jgi:hypothetical protein
MAPKLAEAIWKGILICPRPLKDQKWRPEGDKWEPQISFETFDRCPKINPKRHTNKCYENSSHQELRDPKDVPRITRNPTQKTELESETKRARNGSQQHRLRAADSLLQYRGQSAGQKTENELRGSSFVLDWKTTATVPRTVRAWGLDSPQVRTPCSKESTEKKSQLPDCPL